MRVAASDERFAVARLQNLIVPSLGVARISDRFLMDRRSAVFRKSAAAAGGETMDDFAVLAGWLEESRSPPDGD
jgi:hypothetical protein